MTSAETRRQMGRWRPAEEPQGRGSCKCQLRVGPTVSLERLPRCIERQGGAGLPDQLRLGCIARLMGHKGGASNLRGQVPRCSPRWCRGRRARQRRQRMNLRQRWGRFSSSLANAAMAELEEQTSASWQCAAVGAAAPLSGFASGKPAGVVRAAWGKALRDGMTGQLSWPRASLPPARGHRPGRRSWRWSSLAGRRPTSSCASASRESAAPSSSASLLRIAMDGPQPPRSQGAQRRFGARQALLAFRQIRLWALEGCQITILSCGLRRRKLAKRVGPW